MRIRALDDGTEWPGVNHHQAPPLHLIELQMQAPKVLPGVNIGMRSIEKIGRTQAAFHAEYKAWEARAAAGEDPGEEPTEPDTTFLAVGIIVFLSMRGAGERVTFEQALSRPVTFVPEPDDEPAEAPDPSSPGSPEPLGSPGDEASVTSTGPSTT